MRGVLRTTHERERGHPAMHMGNMDMEGQHQNAPGRCSGCFGTGNTEPRSGKPDSRHPGVLAIAHWLTALFLLLGVTLVLVRNEVEGRAMRAWLLEGHKHLGLLVLILFFVRVALRFALGTLPPERNSMSLRLVAAGTHAALYALILAQPLLGWALSSAEGRSVRFFGLALPPLVVSDEDLADRLQDWHQATAWLLLALIALHVAASLWHHFILKDGVLHRMIPARLG